MSVLATASAMSRPGRASGEADGAADPASSLPARVSVSPAQTMQGFGAAGAWWPNDLVKFAPAVREAVADMLFGKSGIALSVYRYNIGGGGVEVKNPVRAPESFLVSPGTYDWGKDPGGRLFLRMAAERGVPLLIGFVNSAPPIWTANGASCGGKLAPGAEEAYARYLVDVVARFREAEGITLSYVSPMNEPDYLFETCGQEGMGVVPDQRATVVQAVGRELAARAPYCRIIADESSKTGEHFMREASRWLGAGGTANDVAALAVHRYDFPNNLILERARDLAERFGKPLWSTEICCFDSRTGSWGQQYDPTIAGALMMANFMWQGMTVANDAAFHWWVACSSEIGADLSQDPTAVNRPNDDGWNDGLLYYDAKFATNGNQRIYPTKRYYAMGNFSRYVRPGDRRHDVLGGPPNLNVMAFSRPTVGAPSAPAPRVPPVQLPASSRGERVSADWSIVIVNNARPGSAATLLRLQLPAAATGRLVPAVAVETSAERDLESVELPGLDATGLLEARVPAQSLTTYVLQQRS
ncbi:MAG: beta-glycosidase [Chloroflexi bacterium]|nr:beta-glycosidase [Chloroflexota bacterium]